MKKVLLLMLLFPLAAFAQQRDVVYLKNGSIVKGSIKELLPTEKLKIETYDGSLFTYNINEIEKIEKENNPQIRTKNNDKLFTKYTCFVDVSFGGKRSEALSDLLFFSLGEEISNFFSFDLSTTHGAYISEYFFIGAGIELDLTHLTLNIHYPDNTKEQIKSNDVLLPVYVDFRANPMGIKKKVSPFIDLRIGCESLSPAFFISPALGVRFNLEKTALNAAFCYEFYEHKNVNIQDFTAKIGVEF